MKDELGEQETFSQRHYSQCVSASDLRADEQLYSCVYRDFGAWRAVAEYRNKEVWIKYAAMSTDATRDEAERRADGLVEELLSCLERAAIRQPQGDAGA